MRTYYLKEWNVLGFDLVFLYDLTAWGLGPFGSWQTFDKTFGFDLGPLHLTISKASTIFFV